MASKGSTFDTIDLDLKAWPQSDYTAFVEQLREKLTGLTKKRSDWYHGQHHASRWVNSARAIMIWLGTAAVLLTAIAAALRIYLAAYKIDGFWDIAIMSLGAAALRPDGGCVVPRAVSGGFWALFSKHPGDFGDSRPVDRLPVQGYRVPLRQLLPDGGDERWRAPTVIEAWAHDYYRHWPIREVEERWGRTLNFAELGPGLAQATGRPEAIVDHLPGQLLAEHFEVPILGHVSKPKIPTVEQVARHLARDRTIEYLVQTVADLLGLPQQER
jgi:hypothetical protein